MNNSINVDVLEICTTLEEYMRKMVIDVKARRRPNIRT